MAEIKLTLDQQKFVDHTSGNVLVSASAGSGKTSTMIKKLNDLIVNGCDLKQLLVVTYTNSAAAEMKQRLYSKLTESLAAEKDDDKKQYISEQIDTLSNCDIGTLHSICKKILSNYFYIINLDPSFGLISDKEQTYLFDVSLNNVINKLVGDNDADFYEIYTLYNNKRNMNEIKKLVKKLYDFCLSKTDYNAWKTEVLETGCSADFNINPSAVYILNYYKDEAKRVEGALKGLQIASDKLQKKYGDFVNYNINIASYIANICSYDDMCKYASVVELQSKPRVNNKDIDEQIFNDDLIAVYDEFKELVADIKSIFVSYSKAEMEKTKKTISSLFKIKELVEVEYFKAKSQRNVLDFSDLEHLTLKVLENEKIANELKNKYKFIFVDEYQDINQVQETIINKISTNNVGMIGDLKQSIYQFRLSSPEIFIEKFNRFSKNPKDGEVINFNHNFRSDPNILEFANLIFDVLMTKKTIGIEYKENSRLVAGKTQEHKCVVDLDLLNLEKEDDEKEAELIAGNVAKCVAEGYKYADIAILLRNKSKLAQCVIEKLKAYNIPCDATYRTQLFKNNEIMVLYSLLNVVNNADDLSMATTLKSMFCGLNEQQLLQIREKTNAETFCDAVKQYASTFDDEISAKIGEFFKFIEQCRFKLNTYTIYELLQEIFEKYLVLEHYASFKDGAIRVSNINEFLKIVSNNEYKYDLKKCLDYIDALRGGSIPLDVSGGADSVKVMTIHASKGLEFPVVILGGIGKNFRINVDTNSLIINDKLGLGVKIIDPIKRLKRESLVANACKIRNKIDELNEEIRLLYVALTRAKSRLCIVGSKNIKNFKKCAYESLYNGKNYLEFILKTLNKNDIGRINDGSIVVNSGDGEFRFNVISENNFALKEEDVRPIILGESDPNIVKRLEKFYEFKYPFKTTNVAIKNTVTSVLKEEIDYENSVKNANNLSTMQSSENTDSLKLGTAYHSTMQNLNYTENKAEIENLIQKIKTPDLPYEKVDVNKIFNAVNCIKPLISENSKLLKEAQFVMRVNYKDINPNADNVNVLIQGVIDLVIESANGAVIIDFKTNKTKSEKSLIDAYGLQLKLYAKAYNKAHDIKVNKMYLFSFELNKLIEVV